MRFKHSFADMKARRVYMVRWRRADQKVVQLRGRRTETAYQMKYRNLSQFLLRSKVPYARQNRYYTWLVAETTTDLRQKSPAIISCLHHTSSNVIVLTTRTQSAKGQGLNFNPF